MSISSIVLAALLSSSSPRTHTIEGIYPEVTLAADGQTATVRLAYPSLDGAITDRYVGSYTVKVDRELRALIRAESQRAMQGRVRLARAEGEHAWHVIAFAPDSTGSARE